MKVRTVTGLAVAPIALSLLAAGPASAATPAPQTVQAAKTLVDSRIDGRLHKVDGETTLQAIRDDERSMVVDYRVYMLVVPKVRFTIASDDETAAIAKLQDAKGKLAAAIAAAQGQGKDVSAEQAELTDLTTQLGAAQSALNGKVDTLLTVAPSADAAAMTAAVAPVRAAVRAARAALAKGVADAKQIRKQLS